MHRGPQEHPWHIPWVMCQTRSVLVLPSAASGSWEAFVHPLRNHEPTPRCAVIRKFTVLQKFLVALGAPLGELVRPQRVQRKEVGKDETEGETLGNEGYLALKLEGWAGEGRLEHLTWGTLQSHLLKIISQPYPIGHRWHPARAGCVSGPAARSGLESHLYCYPAVGPR